jgi:hypothetical protein
LKRGSLLQITGQIDRFQSSDRHVQNSYLLFWPD